MMLLLKKLFLIVVVGFVSVSCAKTDEMDSGVSTSENQAQSPAQVNAPETRTIVLVELAEKIEAGAVTTWTIRWQDPWLVLFKDDVLVKKVTPDVWFSKVEAMADPDHFQDLIRKRLAIESDINFWQDVKDSGLVNIASPAQAQERIEQKQIELTDFVDSVVYQKASRFDAAFATLRQALEGKPSSALKLAAKETAGDEMMSLIFAPYR